MKLMICTRLDLDFFSVRRSVSVVVVSRNIVEAVVLGTAGTKDKSHMTRARF